MSSRRKEYSRRLEPLEIAAVVIWAFLVSFVGGAVGLVLGNLRLPLMLVFASSPAAGAGANVAVSGAAAVAAAGRHAAGGRLDWRLFWWMAPTSLVGAIAGGLISGEVPDEPLLIAIGIVVVYGAWEVYRHDHTTAPRPSTLRASLVNAAVIGLAVGLLGGFVGLILGSLRLPALVKYAAIPPHVVVGTNAAVGVVVGIGGLVGHLPSGIDWDLFAAGCAGGVPGAYLGAQLTGRLDERALLRACAAVLLISGLAILGQAAFG
jgi:uncharacterized membrane protein YfcA